jgi:hypothetical protein
MRLIFSGLAVGGTERRESGAVSIDGGLEHGDDVLVEQFDFTLGE